MFLRAVCIFLSVVAVSTSDSRDFQFRAIKFGDEGSRYDTLQLLAEADPDQIGEKVHQLILFTSMPNSDKVSSIIGGIQAMGPFKYSEETKYEIHGAVVDPDDGKARLDVVWSETGDGYCRTYTCMVITRDSNNDYHLVNKTITVGAYPGESCASNAETPENQEQESSHTEIPEYIQDAFPDATQEQQEEILDKINSIDNDTYDVSSIYQGKVYIATMQDTNFELHKMNELCKSAGGYLVELDSPEEQYFVKDFLKSLGSYRYFTGANDVDSEGNFVYYNSKKPVTNVVWKGGEPNNRGGNENCVEFLSKGLNDKICTKKRGYICEIPLVDESAMIR